MNDKVKSRLEAIDAECEESAQAELDKLCESMYRDDETFRAPSPQAVEAIWLKLIARKEREFIEAIMQMSRPRPPAGQPQTDQAIPKEKESAAMEEIVRTAFADERYMERMRAFFREVEKTAARRGATYGMDGKRIDLIDSTYRAGVSEALRKARRNVLDEVKLKHIVMEGDSSLLSTWRQYSTLSPWRALWTIAMLSLTSYLIAFIIASDAFRAFLERMGWSGGTGM